MPRNPKVAASLADRRLSGATWLVCALRIRMGDFEQQQKRIAKAARMRCDSSKPQFLQNVYRRDVHLVNTGDYRAETRVPIRLRDRRDCHLGA
jgi:hypothetical protein